MISAKIIQIASNAKYKGLKNIFTHKSSVKNPLCGDKIKIELIANKTKINSMRYQAESCILCEASASLISEKIKNYSLKNLKKNILKLKEQLKDKKSNLPARFKEFRCFLIKDTINRHKCVTLPFDALLKAFKL
jgi:nitrogen fixation NifU-like protein